MDVSKYVILPLLGTSLSLPVSAQVSSENYVQTTQRISDTLVLTTTQYYDGLGRPFEKVEQRVTPSGDNLIHLQQYDGLGREWRSWNPIYSSSVFLYLSDVSSLSQSQYRDKRAFHFVDGADEAVEYEYDANGNMVRDLNKGISSISYDLNNQPRKIEYNDGRNASYVYDAEGSKLSVSYNLTAMSTAQPQLPVMQSSDVASANVSNGQKTIDYCGNIIYDGDETMILNDVGYALYNKDNNLSFHYYLKDHLGNNRVVVSEDGKIEQVNDYYPTGALMASSKSGDTQRFKYNGKELERTNGLNWYDYGARNYDATIVRWDGMDKLCEKYYPFTPYGYCCAKFMNCIDLDGNELFLSGNYKQRLLILSYLNKLTNDNLVVDKNGIVSLSGKERWMNRNKKLECGTKLIREIINNKRTMRIGLGKSYSGNYEIAPHSLNQDESRKKNVVINFDLSSKTTLVVKNPLTNKVSTKNNPLHIALGHELIHGLRDMQGASNDGEVILYNAYNYLGEKKEKYEYLEELETVGIIGNYKYTENKIRKEQGYEERVTY